MNRFSYQLPILGYHCVGVPNKDHVPTVSAAAFERQLRCLIRFGYRVLSLEEIADRLDRGEPLPRRSAAITFDDGYEGTATIAWPLLKRFRMPATVFVTPAEVDQAGFMTWEQVTQVAREGMTIGSHTMHHSYVPLIPQERLSEELVASKHLLEERLSRPIDFLSYPVGGFTPEAQAVAREAGYRAACTTNRAASARGIDRFALRRVKATELDRHPWLFLAKLSGYYDVFRKLKAPN